MMRTPSTPADTTSSEHEDNRATPGEIFEEFGDGAPSYTLPPNLKPPPGGT